MKIYTIGFTQKSAEQFFGLLAENGVRRVVDIRLRPDGQLSGFAKKDDLRYFLEALIECSYVHLPQLSPTDEILKAIAANHDWSKYEADFEALMDARRIPDALDRELFEDGVCCLLCSEASPEKCHRRLVAERLQRAWEDVEIIHL